jgi:hypothetical protein
VPHGYITANSTTNPSEQIPVYMTNGITVEQMAATISNIQTVYDDDFNLGQRNNLANKIKEIRIVKGDNSYEISDNKIIVNIKYSAIPNDIFIYFTYTIYSKFSQHYRKLKCQMPSDWRMRGKTHHPWQDARRNRNCPGRAHKADSAPPGGAPPTENAKVPPEPMSCPAGEYPPILSKTNSSKRTKSGKRPRYFRYGSARHATANATPKRPTKIS